MSETIRFEQINLQNATAPSYLPQRGKAAGLLFYFSAGVDLS